MVKSEKCEAIQSKRIASINNPYGDGKSGVVHEPHEWTRKKQTRSVVPPTAEPADSLRWLLQASLRPPPQSARPAANTSPRSAGVSLKFVSL